MGIFVTLSEYMNFAMKKSDNNDFSNLSELFELM